VSVRQRSGDARDDMVVAALHRLAPSLDGEPDPAFRAVTRARLVAMAAVRSPAPQPATGLERLLGARADAPAPARWRARLTAGLAGAALTVTAAASLVALADGAVPGDVLYGLKRGTEQTQLALAGDSRGQTLLAFASTRLDELKAMVDEGPSALPAAGAAGSGRTVLAAGADPELVISTLETMDDQTTEGTAWLTHRAVTRQDDAPLDDLSVWATAQTAELATLAPELPDAAGAAASHSLALLSEVSNRTDGLRVALTCRTGPAVGTPDALGPTQARCLPATAETPAEQTDSGEPVTVPGTDAGTGTSTPTSPAAPPAGGTTGGGGGGGGLGGVTTPGTPSLPAAPRVPLPGGLPTPSVPGVPLPGSTSAPSLPGGGTLPDLCLSPLATDDC
jgi:hypothetical protein